MFRKGTVSQARNLPSWDGSFALARTLADESGVKPVKLGNDVNVATNAEFVLGAAEKFRSLLGVFWHGRGRRIVLDGRVRGRAAARRARSGTWSSGVTARSAAAGGSGAWRPTRAAR